MASPLMIWRLSDGRRGHDNQSLGLVEALARLVSVDCTPVHTPRALRGALDSLAVRERPRPSLLLGAGHATHLALLVAAHRHRARSIVLMNPSLPRRLFDLCIVPEHDAVPVSANVLTSVGALNRMRPCGERDPLEAVVLLGGPSRHHDWNDAAMLEQIGALVAAEPERRWRVAGSPRTPASMIRALESWRQIGTVRYEDTTAQWLPQQLARAGLVWVSEDSVSMAYESVSSGAPTGLLEVPARGRSRVQAAKRVLLRSGLAIDMSQWRQGARPRAPHQPLQEADRCARALLERWPDLA